MKEGDGNVRCRGVRGGEGMGGEAKRRGSYINKNLVYIILNTWNTASQNGNKYVTHIIHIVFYIIQGVFFRSTRINTTITRKVFILFFYPFKAF